MKFWIHLWMLMCCWWLSVANAQELQANIAVKAQQVAYGADGKTVWTRGKTASLWSSSTGEFIRAFSHEDLSSVAYSPDGKTILTGGYDHTVKLWDVTTGGLLHTLPLDGDYPFSAQYSPDGKTVLIGGTEGDATLWDINRGRLLRTFSGDGGIVAPVIFGSDGKTILTIGEDHYFHSVYSDEPYSTTMKLWNVNTGKLIKKFSKDDKYAIAVDYSFDGKTIITGNLDGTAYLWSVDTGKVIHTFKQKNAVNFARYSKDRKTILLQNRKNTIQKIDIVTGKVLKEYILGSYGFDSAALSPSGKKIIINANSYETGKFISIFGFSDPNQVF